MSIDVYLKQKDAVGRTGSGIFVREDGSTKEITREEWDARNPGREPVIAEQAEDSYEVYSANITHNLGKMAGAAGLYDALWRPDEHGMGKARQLVEPLRAGLKKLRDDPDTFRAHNPANGWGNYEGLVTFTEGLLNACEANPNAEVSVCR